MIIGHDHLTPFFRAEGPKGNVQEEQNWPSSKKTYTIHLGNNTSGCTAAFLGNLLHDVGSIMSKRFGSSVVIQTQKTHVLVSLRTQLKWLCVHEEEQAAKITQIMFQV